MFLKSIGWAMLCYVSSHNLPVLTMPKFYCEKALYELVPEWDERGEVAVNCVYNICVYRRLNFVDKGFGIGKIDIGASLFAKQIHFFFQWEVYSPRIILLPKQFTGFSTVAMVYDLDISLCIVATSNSGSLFPSALIFWRDQVLATSVNMLMSLTQGSKVQTIASNHA